MLNVLAPLIVVVLGVIVLLGIIREHKEPRSIPNPAELSPNDRQAQIQGYKAKSQFGTILIVLSVIGGIRLWFWACATLYALWGVVGVIAGICLAGVGVIPLAILALLLEGNGEPALTIFLGSVFLTALQQFGLRLRRRAEIAIVSE